MTARKRDLVANDVNSADSPDLTIEGARCEFRAQSQRGRTIHKHAVRRIVHQTAERRLTEILVGDRVARAQSVVLAERERVIGDRDIARSEAPVRERGRRRPVRGRHGQRAARFNKRTVSHCGVDVRRRAGGCRKALHINQPARDRARRRVGIRVAPGEHRDIAARDDRAAQFRIHCWERIRVRC